MLYDGPLIHIGIVIAAGSIGAVIMYFKGWRDAMRRVQEEREEQVWRECSAPTEAVVES
jgi:hypothetical protein